MFLSTVVRLLIWAVMTIFGVEAYLKGTSLGSTRSSMEALAALNIRKAVDMIHERVVLSQIVGEYVSLNPSSGSGSYQCLCPFHNDKNNPSMGISDDKGLYNCFSCDAGGDAIKFVQELEQSTFQEAVVKVIDLSELSDEEKKGLQATGNDKGRQFTKEEMEYYRQKERIEAALVAAERFYSSQLLSDPKAGQPVCI